MHLPSNVEKWGRAFEASGGPSGRALGSRETERLLDDSEWVAERRYGPLEDDRRMTSLERSPDDGAAGAWASSSQALLSLVSNGGRGGVVP